MRFSAALRICCKLSNNSTCALRAFLVSSWRKTCSIKKPADPCAFTGQQESAGFLTWTAQTILNRHLSPACQLRFAASFFTLVLFQVTFAQTNALRCHFNQFV